MGVVCGTRTGNENYHAILVINPQENKQFEGPRSRWKDPSAMNE